MSVFAAATAWSLGGQRQAQASGARADVLAIGGSVTEIIYALGEDDRLLARDTTSTFPPEATQLPDVGYMRALSPEGVLSVGPDLIISEDGAGPPETLEVLEAAEIDWVTVPDSYSGDGILAKIAVVGEALGVPEKAEALAAKVGMRLSEAEAEAHAHSGAPKRVLFILSMQGGRILASGTGTAADGIIGMSGGENAVEGFEGYKPLTDEAVGRAAPDVILMMDRSGDHAVDDDTLFDMPSIRTTPAAATRSVIRMDGLYLLGFGPRTADAVEELSDRLYGQ